MKVVIGNDGSWPQAGTLAALRAFGGDDAWVKACARRLCELRPTTEPAMLEAVALDMVRTLAYFDPVLAAEMEFEGGMLDD